MKKITTLIALLVALLVLTGCGSSLPKNMPQLKTSGKLVPKKGKAIYAIYDNGKKKGEEILLFETTGDSVKVSSSISLETVFLDKKTLLPEKIEATYYVNKILSKVRIVFKNGKAEETITREGKTKTFSLPLKSPAYPDSALHFVLQGADFSFESAYLYDFFPYTSLIVPCVAKKKGIETVDINGKKEKAFHVILDFGKKKRDYWISEKLPHLLLKREENGIIFILQSFTGD